MIFAYILIYKGRIFFGWGLIRRYPKSPFRSAKRLKTQESNHGEPFEILKPFHA